MQGQHHEATRSGDAAAAEGMGTRRGASVTSRAAGRDRAGLEAEAA